MATANFKPMNFDMPLVIGGTIYDYDNYKKEWEEENGDEYTEDMFYSDMQLEAEGEQENLKEINNELTFFEIELESGYYDGWQWQVNWLDTYLDYEQIIDDDEFTDEDADYFYGDTAKNIRKQVEEEKQKCKEYLLELKKRGYKEIYKVAQFSNGEAIYKEVKE